MTKFIHPLADSELRLDFSVKTAHLNGCLPAAYKVEDPRSHFVFSRCLEALSFSQGAVMNMASIVRDCVVSPKVATDHVGLNLT